MYILRLVTTSTLSLKDILNFSRELAEYQLKTRQTENQMKSIKLPSKNLLQGSTWLSSQVHNLAIKV